MLTWNSARLECRHQQDTSLSTEVVLGLTHIAFCTVVLQNGLAWNPTFGFSDTARAVACDNSRPQENYLFNTLNLQGNPLCQSQRISVSPSRKPNFFALPRALPSCHVAFKKASPCYVPPPYVGGLVFEWSRHSRSLDAERRARCSTFAAESSERRTCEYVSATNSLLSPTQWQGRHDGQMQKH